MPQKLNKQIIEAAIGGFEAQKRRINEQIAELRAMLTPAPANGAAAPSVGKGKRKLSAAAIERIREGQRRRWAKAKRDKKSAAMPVSKSKPKRKLSAAGRKAIVDALKRRWAANRAAA